MPRSKKTVAEILKEKKAREIKKAIPKKSDKVKKTKPKKTEKKKIKENYNSNFANLRNVSEYISFIDFMATPKQFRDLQTQGEFSKKFGIHQDTLTDWKNRDGFWLDVREARKKFVRENMIGDALASLKRTIFREGKAPEIKLLFQIADEIEEKSVVENRRPTTLTDKQKSDIVNRLKKWQGKS